MEHLQGRVALVTGAAGGIGQAIVERLGREGARVVLADVDLPGAERVAKALSSFDLWPLRVDITSRDEVDQMTAQVEARWGRIDLLVNNAGRTRVGPFITSKEEHWEELLRIDVMRMLRWTQSVLPGMAARRWGRIINIASDAARMVRSFGELKTKHRPQRESPSAAISFRISDRSAGISTLLRGSLRIQRRTISPSATTAESPALMIR